MKNKKKFLKKNLISGLLIIIPTGLTFFLFSLVINTLDHGLAPLIINLLKKTGFNTSDEFHIPGLGFLITYLLIFLIGLTTKNILGRSIVTYWNQNIIRVPFVRSIYLTVKKIMDTLTSTESPSFQQVALLDYPREGLRGLGIVCCNAKGEIAAKFQGNYACVFIPTTPNPTTGFTVILPKEKIVPLNIPIDQAFKMIVSVGMFSPPSNSKTEKDSTSIKVEN